MTRSPRAATSPLIASPVSSRRPLIGLAALIVLGCAGSWPARGQEPGASQAVVTLESGERIVIRLLADDAPNTVSNFLGLVEARFYDGLTFHRVEDWVVQTGCPNGDGTGGPPWTITLETNDHSNVRGAVGMARVGEDPHSAGSQFYILKKDATHLDGSYAVFGQVVSGMEAVDALQQGAVVTSIRLAESMEAAESAEQAPAAAPTAEPTDEEGTDLAPIDATLLENAPYVNTGDLAQPPTDATNPGVRLTLASGGVIIFELRTEVAPVTCAHFARITASGYFSGVYFHRSDAMCIQGGDGATSGAERWSESVDLEISGLPFTQGSVGMARTQDPNSATSQFFFCKVDARHLDSGYANFGQVLQGMDLIMAMPTRELGDAGTPLAEDYRIERAELVRFAP